VQAGQILAAAVFIPLARFMPRDAFMSWGWRVPFLLSVFAVAAGYVIRRESPKRRSSKTSGRAA
jgi:predicted MFS family arabinose efflux permease